MSKKNLLKESTIRQFMKYADIGGLTDNFINENYMDEDEESEMGLGDEGPPAPEMGDKPPAPELGGDEELGGEEIADTSEASIETLVDALADTITQVTGVEVTAAGEGEGEGEDLEAPEDVGALGGEEAGEAGAELPGDEGPEDEPILEDVDVIDEDEVVNETMKRVTRRLKSMRTKRARSAKREALVEDIASRIAKRLKIK
jgi:hypothetical protein